MPPVIRFKSKQARARPITHQVNLERGKAKHRSAENIIILRCTTKKRKGINPLFVLGLLVVLWKHIPAG